MSNETEKPVPHAFLAPGDDRYTLIDGGKPLTKEQAIDALRRAPPKEIGDAAEVELCAYPDDEAPVRLGSVEVKVTTATLGRELARSIMGDGLTILMPTGRR